MAAITAITSEDGLAAWLLSDAGKLHVLFCFADWHEPSKAGGPMDSAFSSLAEKHTDVEFAKVDVDAQSEIAEQLELAAVPSFFFFKSKALVDKLEGADAAELTLKVESLKKAEASSLTGSTVKTLDALTATLQRLTKAAPVMLFMKGTPEEPRCKFSRKAIEMLKSLGAPFGSFDILTNQAVRQGLKDFAEWPTYPMLFINGALVGGVDVMVELMGSEGTSPENNELRKMVVAAAGDPSALSAKVGCAPEKKESGGCGSTKCCGGACRSGGSS